MLVLCGFEEATEFLPAAGIQPTMTSEEVGPAHRPHGCEGLDGASGGRKISWLNLNADWNSVPLSSQQR